MSFLPPEAAKTIGMKHYFISLLCLLASLGCFAQVRTVSGIVTDAGSGEPLAGITVLVPGTDNGTATDQDGRYSLRIQSAAKTLTFTSLGYEESVVTLRQATDTYNVSMRESTSYLDELIVIGYGTVKKSDLTGSVGSLRSDDITKNNPMSVEKGMQGRLAGVNVVQNDGAPGSGISVQIRGTNSFLGGTEPLYVVDGIPITTSNDQESINFESNTYAYRNAISFLDPNDIASIEVLKDASSTAIYGSRGANGVILITTRSGTGAGSRDVVTLNYTFSLSDAARRIKMLGASDYAQYRNESAINTAVYTGATITREQWPFPGMIMEDGKYSRGPQDYDNDPYYWQDQIFRLAGTHNLNVNVAGSSKGSDYSISGSLADQDGTVINSSYKRYSLKIDFNKQVKPWLKVGTSTNLSRAVSDMLKTTINSQSNGTEGVIRSALMYPPVYKSDDKVAIENEFSTVTTPNLYTQALNRQTNSNIYTSNYAEVTFTPWLMFRSALGFNHSMNTANQYWPRYLYEGRSVEGKSYAGDNSWYSVVWDNLLMMNKSFGKHNFNATLGTSWEESHWYNKRISVQTFGTDLTNGWLLQDAAAVNTPYSSKGDSKLFSVIMRAAYNYNSKYYLTLTAREDMSGKFTKQHRSSFFPSAGVSWRLSEENFMSELRQAVNEMKIHYSYGMSGNQAISSYQTFAMMTSANYPFGGSLVNGYAPDPGNPGNADLKWETTYQHDLGIEASLFNRVDLSVDWYHKRTCDLLQYKEVATSTGLERILSNAGTVINTGMEVMVDAVLFERPRFHWSVGGNISFNRNEMRDFSPTPVFPNSLWNSLRPFALMDGHPIGSLYGFIEDGIWSSRAEIIQSDQFQAQYPGYTVDSNETATEIIIKKKWLGEIRYKNLDDDPNITDKDQTFIGNTNPDFFYGIHTDLRISNFDISILLQGVYGNDIFNMNLLRFYDIGNSKNIPQDIYNRAWTPVSGGTAPKNFYDAGRTIRFSRRYVEDGSYLKLRNVSLGYTCDKIKGINSVRFFVSGNNLLTFTKYSGYDPEVNSFGSDPSLRGIDSGGYPQAKTVMMGVNLTF